jgi:hypothetical protein
MDDEDPEAVKLLGELMCAVEEPSVPKESMALVLRQNQDPFDPDHSDAHDALKAAFGENRDAMVQWLKCQSRNIAGWPLEQDFRDDPQTTLGGKFLFLQQPFIPCGPDGQLTDPFTWSEALCADEEGEYQKLFQEAFTHVVGKKHWPMHTNGNMGADGKLFIPAKGTLCTCAKLGELTDIPIIGKACGENLAFCQIKGENNKISKPTRSVYIFCAEHIDCSSSAMSQKKPLRILRIMAYVIANISLIARATGGKHFLDPLALPVYRKMFLARKPLLVALMVHAMTQTNWLAAKLEEEQPFVRKPNKSAGRSGSVSSGQISITGFLKQKNAKSSAAIKQAGAAVSPSGSVFSPRSFGNLKRAPSPGMTGPPSGKKAKAAAKPAKGKPNENKKELSEAEAMMKNLSEKFTAQQLQAMLNSAKKTKQ